MPPKPNPVVTACCKCCGKTFEYKYRQNRKPRQYCGVECRNALSPRLADDIVKTCAQCGAIFHVKPHLADKRLYCSRGCANRSSARPAVARACAGCGREFSYVDYGTERSYCSHDCYNASRRKSVRSCPQCHRRFRPKKHGEQKYCSAECRALARRKRAMTVCLNCGRMFSVIPSRGGRTRYCSRRCQLMHQFYSREEQEAIDLVAKLLNRTPLRQHAFPWLLSDTGRPLHVDAYFQDHSLAVEYDGKQHRQFIHYYHRTNDSFRDAQERDRAKDRLLSQHGIILLRIRDDEPKTEEHVRFRLHSVGISMVAS